MLRFFAAHPTAANLLMAALIALGLIGAPSLTRETFPEFATDVAEVRMVYPGASAEDVETAICRRLETAISGVEGVAEQSCDAREGVGVLRVEMRDGADFQVFVDDIRLEVDALEGLPEEIETPIVREAPVADPVVSIAVSGPMAAPDLKGYVEDLKTRLERLDEVSLVTVRGFSAHQIRIETPALTLRQLGLSIADVAQAVSRQSLDLPAGVIETRDRDVLVRFVGERRTPADYADVVVAATESGSEIRLGDIAVITDRFALDEDAVYVDGVRAGLLMIEKTGDQDTLTVRQAVGRFVERERESAPPGVRLTPTQDVASIVQDRLDMLIRNGLQGLLLVVVVLTLFFNFRFAFWVVAGLPTSFLGAIFFMSAVGYSINMITMVGLLIAIGLLMDDAIVIAENVATHRARGLPGLEAAVRGTREVLPGVAASFLTSVFVFAPLSFLEGEIGKVLQVLPVVLIAVLAVSLVEAFLILPHHLSHALGQHAPQPPGRIRGAVENALAWTRERVVGHGVDAAIAWRYLTLGLAVLAFIVSIAALAGGLLKFRAFPELDGDVAEARVLLPQGTPLARTKQVVEHLITALGEAERVVMADFALDQSPIARVTRQFNVNADARENGPHLATITLDLTSAETRPVSARQILDRWRDAAGPLTDVISVTFSEPTFGPGGLAIEIRLQGDRLERLKAASSELIAWLNGFAGVLDVSDDLRPGKPEARITLGEGAAALGVDARALASQLRAGFFGQTAHEIQVGVEDYDIDVRLDPRDQDTLGDLEYFAVTTSSGAQAPLTAVATIASGRGFARIQRIDGQRTVTVTGDVDADIANAREIIAATQARFMPEFSERYPDVTVDFQGQQQSTEETGGSLRRGFAIGMLSTFVLLSFLFRSYIEPIIVMMAIPMALVGVVWGHLLMGLDLSMPSIMGFASLSGVVVNDSILLVEFTKLRRAEGAPTVEAARMASRRRFRAILLTTLTTVAGLLPLLAETSLQAQVLIPLVVSLVFGMLASTLMVLFVIPAMYAILDDFGLTSSVAHKRIEAAAGK